MLANKKKPPHMQCSYKGDTSTDFLEPDTLLQGTVTKR